MKNEAYENFLYKLSKGLQTLDPAGLDEEVKKIKKEVDGLIYDPQKDEE